MQEFMKWGAPTDLANGKNVVCIMIYKDYVNLGFFQGTKMKSKRLEGIRKGLRHVKARRLEDIDGKRVLTTTKEALELARW